MFKSFFPQPVWFFSSLVLWFLINLGLWYSGGSGWGVYLGMTEGYHDLKMPIGISRFWAPKFLWFYLWFFVSTAIFALPSGILKRNIPGSAGPCGVRPLSCSISGLGCRLMSS